MDLNLTTIKSVLWGKLMDVSVVFNQIVDKLVLAGIVGLVVWPLKIFKRKVETFTKQISEVHAELILQRTNCLTTLQHNSAEMLKEQRATHESIKDGNETLLEMKGFLEGMSR